MQRDILELAPGVLVTSSRRDLTTSTVLVDGDDVALVDPAWDPDELDWLAEFVSGMRYRARTGIATHAHHDHLLWHPVLGDAPRWASARTVELVDGHAPGHAAVWLPETRVLLAGDMLSDVELPLPLDPDDLGAYLSGLDTLAPYVAQARMLVPGHGRPTTSPGDRLDADRRYLDSLLAGNDPDDPRRSNPGMAEVHNRVTTLATAHG